MKNSVKRYLPFLTVAVIILIDQAVKYWAVTVLKFRDSIEVIPDVFYLTFATNNGAAWSMFSGQRILLIAVSVAALFLIMMTLLRGWVDTAFGRYGVYFVLGGALGNFIDRVFRTGGLVVDLFYFKPTNFPVFNIADTFITIGGIMFGIFILNTTLRDYRRKKTETNDGGDRDG